LPEAPRDVQMVQLSTLQGAGLSTAVLGSQDVETSTTEVQIAPGTQPLYLVLSSTQPVIWRITGAVGRVERLVLSSETGQPGKDYDPMPLTGETGVPEDRVFTVRRVGCLGGFDPHQGEKAQEAADFVEHQSGRRVELQQGASWAARFLVPSAQLEKIQIPWLSILHHLFGLDTPEQALQFQLMARWPQGVIPIPAGRVVSTRSVEPYEVMPGAAGLQQLVRNGTLTQLGADEFAVHRAFHFPAGIHGNMTRFLLDRKYGTSAACHLQRDNRLNEWNAVVCD
jgi:hypothetical protein